MPIVDVFLPSGHGNHVKIPHVNLYIKGYEPDSLRTLVGTRSPSMRTHEISAIPQLDRPRSPPRREPDRGWMNEVPGLTELGSSQEGTYVQGASAPRRREYLGGDSNDDDYRRPHRDQRPPERGWYPKQGGRPPEWGGYPDRGPPGEGYPHRNGRTLEEEDTQEEDPLMEMEDPLIVEDLLVMEGPWTSWWTRTTRPSRTPWTSETNSSANSPSDLRYICSEECIWFCWTIYVAIGQSTRSN